MLASSRSFFTLVAITGPSHSNSAGIANPAVLPQPLGPITATLACGSAAANRRPTRHKIRTSPLHTAVEHCPRLLLLTVLAYTGRLMPEDAPAATTHAAPPVLTTDEAANLLRISRRKLLDLVRSGRIPAHRLPGTRT